MFAGMATYLPWRGAPERCFTWVDFGLTCKYYTRLGRLTRDKHSILLTQLLIVVVKFFITLGPEVSFSTFIFGAQTFMQMTEDRMAK